MFRHILLTGNCIVVVAAIVISVGCTNGTSPGTSAPNPAVTEAVHGHQPSVHGGTLISIGKDNFHAEAVFEQGAKLRLYMLGADETKVMDVEDQTLRAFVKVGGMKETLPFELRADPQPGDQQGRTSQFVAELPPDAVGKPVQIVIPSVRIGADRFRIAFASDAAHTDTAMPAKLGSEEEQQVFFTPGGAYTAADITTNGKTVAAVKYRGVRAQHDDNPKPGEAICPISKTKANPKFTWVIGGKTYSFCCVPCIEEFVLLAKEKPAEIKDPKDYVK